MNIADKRYIFIWVFVFNIFVLNAQTFFSEGEENLIFYSPAIAPTAVCVGDFGDDGDPDVLSFFDKKFRLYNHLDGKGTFSEQKIITDSNEWILSVYISDLNKDGKQDILAASYNNDRIIWYENEGDITFGAYKTITDSAKGASSVYAADLDRDGDQDVISASIWDNKIAWYENMGGGVFGEQQVITEQAEGARYVYVSDLNGDSLQDVLSASIYDNKIAWYENEGGGIFGEQQIISDSAARAICVYTADLDGDSIPDVLSASAWDNKIAWYKNDGQGNLGEQQVISNSLKRVQSVYTADLDEDGDQDVLSASLLDDKIAWYENKGMGEFGMQLVVTNSADMPGFVYSTDIDGDGYKDIVSASTDFKIAWYENTLPLKIVVNPRDTVVFPDNNAGFKIIADSATGYQWQCNDGDDFSDLSNNDVYAGVTTNTLEITGVTFDLQGNQYRCLAINGSDSLSSAVAELTVIDTTKPVITSTHPDTILPADWNCNAEIQDYTGKVEASDNSYEALLITQTPVPWSKVTGTGVEITLAAADPAGNSSQVIFNVDVVDQTPPVLTPELGSQNLEAGANGKFILPDFTDSTTATDNCSEYSSINITQEPEPYYVIPDSLLIISVTLTATDEAGNSTQVSFNAVTIDEIPPVIISMHNDTAVEGNFRCVAYMPDFRGEVEATDNFDGFSELSITQSPEANTVISGNDNLVTLTIKDKAGNTSEVTFNVEVSSIKPTIICIQDQILNLTEGQTTHTVSGTELDPTSLEFYCGIASLTNNINDTPTLKLAEFVQDTTQVVWTLTDQEGYIAQCSFNVIINKLVGIETFQKHGISVYPNPTTGDIFIESSSPVQQIRILDLRGSIMMERTDIPEKGLINIAGFEGGTYILSVITDKSDYRMKIMKE